MSKKTYQNSNAFKRLGERLKSNVSREFLTYLVFLLIAIVIWYANTLTKDYTTELKFNVKYIDLPEDKVLVSPPPNQLTLTIHAQGLIILKYKLGLIFYPISLEANLQTLRKNKSSKDGEYFITTQSVFDKIAGQLNSDVSLRNIVPDTLKFLFSETVQKNVPVKALLQLQFEKEFLPKGPMQIVPKAVTVTGTKNILDTLQYVYTRQGNFKKLKDTLRTDLALQSIPNLKYSVDKVNIIQPIERHTEATITVPIESINLAEGLKMKTFPSTVTVSCMVPINDFEKLQPYLFRIVADYATVKDIKNSQAKVRVNLVKSPDYVSDIRFHPKNVDFIIEK